MAHRYAKTLFTDAMRGIQERFGSRAQYERLASQGPAAYHELGFSEVEFIRRRDSFYLASVTADGWPYVQHRGGPPGFLRVLDAQTLAFADFAGNKQYISTGNLATDDRVSLFLMDYPHRTRLKILGHAAIVELGSDPELERAVTLRPYGAKLERVIRIQVVAFDWNCPQHITQRFTQAEWEAMLPVAEPPA